MGRETMSDGAAGARATDTKARAALVISNLVGAAAASALTAIGLFLFAYGGPGLGIPGGLLATAAAPLAAAFWLAGISWMRDWRHARKVQLLPFLVVLGWSALIFLSPVQHHPPTP
jgi:hypothetical protein